jgi:hypothetical protein
MGHDQRHNATCLGVGKGDAGYITLTIDGVRGSLLFLTNEGSLHMIAELPAHRKPAKGSVAWTLATFREGGRTMVGRELAVWVGFFDDYLFCPFGWLVVSMKPC